MKLIDVPATKQDLAELARLATQAMTALEIRDLPAINTARRRLHTFGDRMEGRIVGDMDECAGAAPDNPATLLADRMGAEVTRIPPYNPLHKPDPLKPKRIWVRLDDRGEFWITGDSKVELSRAWTRLSARLVDSLGFPVDMTGEHCCEMGVGEWVVVE